DARQNTLRSSIGVSSQGDWSRALGCCEQADPLGLLHSLFIALCYGGSGGTCRLCGSQRVFGCLCPRSAGKGYGGKAPGRNGLDQLAILGGGGNADGGVNGTNDAGTVGRRTAGHRSGNEDALSGLGL